MAGVTDRIPGGRCKVGRCGAGFGYVADHNGFCSAIVFVAVGPKPVGGELMAYGAVGTVNFLSYTLFYAASHLLG
jgi:hypothetical protein